MLPKKATSHAKRLFQRGRAQAVATRYGNPGQNLKLVVILGTNGKSTTAAFLSDLLTEAGQSAAVLSSEDGRTLGPAKIQTFLRDTKKAGARYAILTLSAGDLREHSLGTMPIELVIVTNISESLGETTAAQSEATAQLLENQPRYIVLNRDDPSYEALSAYPAAAQKITYGHHDEAEAHISSTRLYRKGSEVRVVIDHQTTLNLATHLVGQINIENLVAATTALYVMGESIDQVAEGAARRESAPANYQYLTSDTPYSVVLDCAPNEASLERVLTSAKQVTKQRLLAVVQANTTSDECLEKLSKLTARLVVVDVNDMKRDKGSIERVVSSDAAIKIAVRAARQGDTVLLAGPIFARIEPSGESYAQTTVSHVVKE